MKCVHSVVLSKVNACVSERKVVCTAVVNRVEKGVDFHKIKRTLLLFSLLKVSLPRPRPKGVDFHAMIREKFWFHSSAGLGPGRSSQR